MADTVTGDEDLEDWGLDIFGEFLSTVGGELIPEGEGLVDPERLPESISDSGKSGGPST